MKSKYMLTKKTIIIIVIIILFIILLYIINYKSYNNKRFYKCSNNLGKITDNIFANFNFKHNNKNWDIYMPCGYNNVENELKTINVNGDKSKIIFGGASTGSINLNNNQRVNTCIWSVKNE